MGPALPANVRLQRSGYCISMHHLAVLAVVPLAASWLLGCASTGRPPPVDGERELRARAELLCRHSVVGPEAAAFARHAPDLAPLVLPDVLARVPPCEPDLGDVSKCVQEKTDLSLAKLFAPHVRCQVLAVESHDDRLVVRLRQDGPRATNAQVLDATQGRLDLATLPTTSAEVDLAFHKTSQGWLADPSASRTPPRPP